MNATYLIIDFMQNQLHMLLVAVILTIILLVIHRYKQEEAKDFYISEGEIKDITVKQFYRFIDKKKFSLLSPKLAQTHILDPIRYKYAGYDICLFQLGIGDGTDGGAYQTAVYMRSNLFEFPKFLLKPEGMSHKIAALFGREDINFPGNPAFSDSYYLKGENESQIRALFNPAVLTFFEKHDGLTIETNENEIIIFKYRDLAKREQFTEYVDRAIGFIDLFTEGQLPINVEKKLNEQDSPEAHAKRIMTGAKIMIAANIFIISFIMVVHGGALSIIISIFLVVEGLGFLGFALWKKKTIMEKSNGSLQ